LNLARSTLCLILAKFAITPLENFRHWRKFSRIRRTIH